MSRRAALAEDLRRLGLILLTAGVIGGLLQGKVGIGTSLYTVIVGVLVSVGGYWMTRKEDKL